MQVIAAPDTSPVEMPKASPFIKGETNRRLLRAAWRVARLQPHYPLSTREVFSVLKLMGFSVDRPVLDYCLARYMTAPKKSGNAFVWTEADVTRFADCLESLRRWLPGHPSHLDKLTPDEFARHQIEAAKRGAALQAFDCLDLHEVIDLLAKCENPDTRELLAMVVRKKTGVIHLRGTEEVPADDPREAN